jgi:sigma-E factor negative regulatory protein RseB
MIIRLYLALFLFAAVSVSAYAEQVYFKIAVDENEYSVFYSDKASSHRHKLHQLAAKMRQVFFDPSAISRDYYDVKVSSEIRFLDRNAVQYDMTPLKPDRFRQVILLDKDNGQVIKKEIYNTEGKLVFAFVIMEKPMEDDEMPSLVQASEGRAAVEVFKGYHMVLDHVTKDGTRHMAFSDGLNNFSIFRRPFDTELNVSKRIMYGNNLYREKVGNELFTVVGTIPFEEMTLLVKNIVDLEEND